MNRASMMRAAIETIASKVEKTRQNHVAFLFRKSKLVTIGCNKPRTHPATKKYHYEPKVHICAELDACLKAGDVDFTLYTMLVIRIKKDGSLGMSKPCPGCQHLLKSLGIKSVMYSDESGEIVSLR